MDRSTLCSYFNIKLNIMKNRLYILGEIIETDIWNYNELNNCFKLN